MNDWGHGKIDKDRARSWEQTKFTLTDIAAYYNQIQYYSTAFTSEMKNFESCYLLTGDFCRYKSSF